MSALRWKFWNITWFFDNSPLKKSRQLDQNVLSRLLWLTCFCHFVFLGTYSSGSIYNQVCCLLFVKLPFWLPPYKYFFYCNIVISCIIFHKSAVTLISSSCTPGHIHDNLCCDLFVCHNWGYKHGRYATYRHKPNRCINWPDRLLFCQASGIYTGLLV